MDRPTLLVVDDIPEFLAEMSAVLQPDFTVVTCASPLQAVEMATGGGFSLVLTTLVMRELDGFELIRRIRGRGVQIPILLVTGFGNANTAVEALRLGASDYLSKPVESRELLARVHKALDEQEGKQAAFFTADPATRELIGMVRRVAGSDARVLIHGETGTGKELIARMLHDYSPHREHPFVAVNCAALPANLIESELFGHVRGAFTGAHVDYKGKFEEAGEGTIFLDEIGELGIALQSKLLRVLQNGEYQRVGSSANRKLRARVIAATNRDLRIEVREGRFRQDLYYRLNVVSLAIPPLRGRSADVRPLAERFIKHYSIGEGQEIRFSGGAWKLLEAYDWPGNVRELEHLVERLSIIFPGREIHPEDLPELKMRQREVVSRGITGYAEALERFQKDYFREVLETTGYHITRSAALAGMDKAQFHRTIVRLGLHKPGSTRTEGGT